MKKRATKKNHAAEIRLRAERRLGEMLRRTVPNKGAAAGGKKTSSRGTYLAPRDTTPTLTESGISKKLSSRAQELAAAPEEKFEAALAASILARARRALWALKLTPEKKINPDAAQAVTTGRHSAHGKRFAENIMQAVGDHGEAAIDCAIEMALRGVSYEKEPAP